MTRKMGTKKNITHKEGANTLASKKLSPEDTELNIRYMISRETGLFASFLAEVSKLLREHDKKDKKAKS